MRIIGISGVWCPDYPIGIWHPLGRAFKRHFPLAQLSGVYQEPMLHPWEISRMRRLCDRVVTTHDDGAHLLLVGHSMGGVFASAIANRFKKSIVCGVVTIFSPHLYWVGSLCAGLIGEWGEVRAPVISFGAAWDELVTWGTRHPQSVAHVTLPSTHYLDLIYNPDLSEQIAATTKKVLFP